MSHPVDVHPEDLLDKKRRGALSGEERDRLEAHLALCPSCAMQASVVSDFEHDRQSQPGDTALALRLVDAAMSETAAARAALVWVDQGARRRRRGLTIGLALAFAATAAGAGFWSGKKLFSRSTDAPPAVVAPTLKVAAPEAKAPAPRPARAEPEAKAELPAVDEPAVGSPRAPAAAPPTAAEVFARANDARRQGDLEAAVRGYQRLAQQHAGSREEVMSRVALARLLLDRMNDPAGALALFDRYLGASPGGTLAEEARLGKALSLMRLGRTAEERQAWEKLLSAHPSSIYAERARRRLAELE